MAATQDNKREQDFKEAFRQFVEAQLFGQEPNIEELVRNYPEFEDQIRQKLERFQKVDSLFGSIVRADESDFDEPVVGYDLIGQKVGNYKIIEMIGEGGMGIVYLAEQQGSIRRRVALKVIKPGMDSKRVLARFEAERQALALLDHPNIAQVYDAGTTVNGRPYFVMEYVKGLPITEYCDYRMLRIEERLRLFQQVCQAVHHAHQKAIIHRDVKPSNILVTTQDDQPVPKIIDFGVAKAIAQPLTERTLYTEQGQLFGTPEYMSPEQADMATEDIDTRSDIYSLGVLLYVLLTGVLPFDSETYREGGIDHIRKVIRETDPKTPSTRLTSLGDEAEEVAQKRQTEVGTLARRLHKELEWIPLMAMRKDRTRRYRSASELSDDIQNYLKGAPLMAGPESTMYRVKKFVRRNAVLSAAVLATVVTLLFGLIATSVMYLRAEEALDKEARARADAQTIANFLTKDVLASAQEIRGRDATVIDILNAAVEKINEGEFRDQPLIEAEICWELARTYSGYWHHRAAIPLYERVCQIRGEQLGEHAIRTLNNKFFLALSYVYAGQYKKAERLFNEIIALHRRHYPEIVGGLPRYMGCLSLVYKRMGRYEEAEQLIVEMWKFDEALWDPVWKREARPFQDHMADIYVYQGRYEEADQMYTEMMEKEYPLHGDRVYTWMSMEGWPRLYITQGRYEEAENFLIKGVQSRQRELVSEAHPNTLIFINCLGVLRTKQKQYEEAEAIFEEVLEARKRRLGPDHPSTLETINDFGVLRREQKRYNEAESLLRQALDARQNELGTDHPACFESMHELAVLYKEQGDYDKSEPLLLKAIEGRRLKLGGQHPHTQESMKNLIDLYESWNKPDQASQWRAKSSAPLINED